MSSAFVIITGASKGIGRACAQAFVKNSSIHKLKLCLLARNLDGLAETSRLSYAACCSSNTPKTDTANDDEKSRKGKEVHISVHQIDISDLDSLEGTIQNIMTENNNNDGSETCSEQYDHYILINNAGSLGYLGKAKALPSPRDLQSNIEFNLASSCWISSYFLRWVDEMSKKQRVDKKKCTVVNMSSLCAISPFPTMAAYCAGKAYRDMFHTTMALEETKNMNHYCDVKILNYAPGAVATDMTQALGESKEIDSELNAFFKEKDESKFVRVEDTSNKLIDLVLRGNFESGKHIDFWDEPS